MFRVLAINPGSTSTKAAVYEDANPLFSESINHPPEELAAFDKTSDQYPLRRDFILKSLARHGLAPESLSAVAGRGGVLPPLKAGAYEVNQAMLDYLHHKAPLDNASNLGAIIADAIAKPLNIKAYIYDGVSVDEMSDLARITGLPQIRRKALGHNLNMRAMARRHAQSQGRAYEDMTLIVAHLGGGITLSLHHQGRMIDMITDDEGPFSPERAGGLPGYQLLDLSEELKDKAALMKMLHGQGGLMAHFQIKEAREIEARIKNSDARARLVYEAMALAVAKNIAKLAVTVSGKVEAIILTGGLAHSEMLTNWIRERASFIAPVISCPGEHELAALALGILRVLKGQEKTHVFNLA